MSKPDIDREYYLNMFANYAKAFAATCKPMPPGLIDADEEIVNPPVQSGEITPEPDQSVWVSFTQAQAMTGLQPWEITRACENGKIRSQGKRKGRKVHSGDLSSYMAAINR